MMRDTNESEKANLANRPSWASEEEIDTFDQFVHRFWNGEISPDEFKRFRLQNGIYGQRQEGEQMFRIKIPWGGLSAAQLELLAELAAKTKKGVGHVKTRQNIQLHFIKLDQVAGLMRSLASVGLTTRGACGNTVRNVTIGHCAGICPQEVFDVTPYAAAVARFLLRNPMNQNLPRKFKIAFSGCPDDLGLTPIQDIGASEDVPDVASWVVPHSVGPRFPGPLLIRTRCPDTSPNSTPPAMFNAGLQSLC